MTVPEWELRKPQGDLNVTQKSAAGVVGSKPKAQTVGARLDAVALKVDMRQQTGRAVLRCGRRCEAPRIHREESNRLWRLRRRKRGPPVGLNWLNRRVRTRMHGGVGGGGP